MSSRKTGHTYPLRSGRAGRAVEDACKRQERAWYALENLWRRALLSPIQLPSYFIGFRVFDDAFDGERARLGEDFSTKAFNNAVVNSGGITMEMVAEYLSAELDRDQPSAISN